ncbi:MAG: sodium:solute symporter [Coriobacteriia bacterium]|nr:sodium:solute symporter [Coriobacteriia bacterium]
MTALDYIIIAAYFIGLILVSVVVSKKIKSSEDMFIAGRNSSWWLSGVSSYMTIFSASTFVVWGGVAYKSGIVAVSVAVCLGIASFMVGKWVSGKWRELSIKSPGEFLTIRFGNRTLNFYTVLGIIVRAVHTAVALYSVAIVMCALIRIPPNGMFSFLASTGLPGDSEAGYLSIWWALGILGVISILYTVLGGFLAVLMTDVVQFGVLLTVVVFMIPLSFNAVGGIEEFFTRAAQIPGFLSGTSNDYNWFWLFLWIFLNCAMIGGDWPFVQRYISVPTVKDAKKSTYLIGFLYIVTPFIWYLPTMALRTLEPNLGMALDATQLNYNGEHAYVNMSVNVLMSGMVGMMLAAMLSATLSNVSGTLNVYANVFTYEIWNKLGDNKNAPEKRRIKIGRRFTFLFGLSILLISMLIPFAGGAEKVVVTLLTMVLCPLYIPSIWGLFSKRLTGNQLIFAMVVAWILGFTAKFTVPTDIISSSLMDSICGCVIPIVILTVCEIYSKIKGKEDPGFDKIQEYKDPTANDEPSIDTKKATKFYSHMAITVFCITIGVIALLLAGMLIAGDPKTVSVSHIVIWFIVGICAIIAIYVIYRIIDWKRNK